MFVTKKSILNVCEEESRKGLCDKHLRKGGNGGLKVGEVEISNMKDLRTAHNKTTIEVLKMIKETRQKLAKIS